MERKEELRLKRHRRILLKLQGTSERPRLTVRRGLKNITASLVNDLEKRVIFSLSTSSKEIKGLFSKQAGNLKATEKFAEIFASKLKEKGIKRIIFDRAGYLYHGRIKTFAEALRKNGMEF